MNALPDPTGAVASALSRRGRRVLGTIMTGLLLSAAAPAAIPTDEPVSGGCVSVWVSTAPGDFNTLHDAVDHVNSVGCTSGGLNEIQIDYSTHAVTNGLIIEQTLRATDASARQARERGHSGPMSSERNAAGRRVRSSLRA